MSTLRRRARATEAIAAALLTLLAGAPACLASTAPDGGQTPAEYPLEPTPPHGGGHGHGGGKAGHCKPSIEASSLNVAAGETVTFKGVLQCGDSEAAAGQAVTLLERTPGSEQHGLRAVANVTTESDGSFRLISPPLAQTSVFVVRAQRARSARCRVLVTASVTLQARIAESHTALTTSAGSVPARTTVSFSGHAIGVAANAIAVLQRERPTGSGKWSRIERSAVGQDGRYAMNHAFRRPGTVNLRVLVRRAGRAVGVSEVVSFAVIGHQNPNLTIEGPTAPVAYGEAIQIHGVATAAPGEEVELIARQRGASPATVATATTDDGGNYSFTQAPTANTVYVVRSASEHSVALPVQVRYVLSPLDAPGSLHSGEAFTFSGTAEPALPGTVVFLDRGNASGTEFHQVASATLAGDGTFALAHEFAAHGSGTYRIRVAGTSGLVTATGEPFSVLLEP